jgi:hypothetical protein
LVNAGEHRAWVLAAPAHAELLLLQGDASAAVRAADAIVQAVAALALDRAATVSAERVRALAASQLGDHAQAAASIERAFAVARELEYGGLPLAQLHEAHSRVALAAGDSAASVDALTSFWKLIEHADAPALWNAYETLRGQNRALLGGANLLPTGGDVSIPLSTETYTQVRTRFSALSERRERAQHALSLLLEECQVDAGHLLLFEAGRLFVAASLGCASASDQLVGDAQRLLALDANPAETMALTTSAAADAAESPSGRWLSDGEASFAPVLLVDGADGHALLSGVALVTVRGEAQRQPRSELVQALSRCLRAAGDSAAVAVQD